MASSSVLWLKPQWSLAIPIIICSLGTSQSCLQQLILVTFVFVRQGLGSCLSGIYRGSCPLKTTFYRGNCNSIAKCAKRWAQWLRQRLEAALSCGERRCQRQCVHVDAHFNDSFEITSLINDTQPYNLTHIRAFYCNNKHKTPIMCDWAMAHGKTPPSPPIYGQ